MYFELLIYEIMRTDFTAATAQDGERPAERVLPTSAASSSILPAASASQKSGMIKYRQNFMRFTISYLYSL